MEGKMERRRTEYPEEGRDAKGIREFLRVEDAAMKTALWSGNLPRRPIALVLLYQSQNAITAEVQEKSPDNNDSTISLLLPSCLFLSVCLLVEYCYDYTNDIHIYPGEGERGGGV